MYGKDQIERDAAEDYILQLGKVGTVLICHNRFC
jgi:hypothetical protein